MLGFIKDPARKSLVLIGGFMVWMGVRGLFPDPSAGIGPV